MIKPTSSLLADSRRHTSEPRDQIEITDLIDRLGACLDEHRFHDLHGLLTEDAMAATPGGATEKHSARDRV